MPIDDELHVVPMMGNVVQVPVVGERAGVFMQIQNLGSATDEQMDEILMSLVDLLQGWEFRHPQANVTGQRYLTGYYDATPTNPVVINNPPPEDPAP